MTPDMVGNVIFVSHEWLSFDHPDPDGDQRSALHKVLTRLAEGKVKEVRGTVLAEQFLGQKIVVKADGWKRRLPHMFLWLDYMSVPQPTVEKTRPGPDLEVRVAKAEEGLSLAVASIPSYIEWTTLMLVLVPVLKHRARQETICGYDTWRSRGWCRVEFLGAYLSRNKVRVMVVKGGKARPKFVAPYEAVLLHPLEGEFTCCQRKHISSAGKAMSCDKRSVLKVLRTMLAAKVSELSKKDDIESQFMWRYWVCASTWYFKGYSKLEFEDEDEDEDGDGDGDGDKDEDEDRRRAREERTIHASSYTKAAGSIGNSGGSDNEPKAPTEHRAVEKLVHKLRWTPLHEAEGRKTGFTLLIYAIISDDILAVTELLETRSKDFDRCGGTLVKDDLNRTFTNNYPDINVVKGMSPLSLAVVFASFAVVSALLDDGAKTVDGLGRDALVYAASAGRHELVAQWLERFPAYSIDRAFRGGTSVFMAAMRLSINTLEVAKVLLAAGAKTHVVVAGRINANVLLAASHNDQADGELLRFLAQLDDMDIDGTNTAASCRLSLYAALAKAARRIGIKLPGSKFLLQHLGSTALHYAASKGNGNAVRALLQAGANPNLRNGLGQTPYRSAEKFFGKGQVPRAIAEEFSRCRRWQKG